MCNIKSNGFLLLLVTIGYILVKFCSLEEGTEKVLSKLENYLFISALVLGTFINNFTLQKLATAKSLLLVSFIIELIVIPASYGKDTTVASGMALVSQVFSCVTIPIMLFLLNL